MPDASTRRGRAFAPAHVTGVFAPRLSARDPRGRGSVGAGLVLEVGVTASASWAPARRATLAVTAEGLSHPRISTEVAARLAALRPGRWTVSLEQTLPVGQGFGSSAAGALATALAVAAAGRLPQHHAVEVAHLADLFGGGGLGGVAAILGGGLELRLAPGIPPLGRVVHRDLARTVVLGTVGAPTRSPTLLQDPAALRRFSSGESLFEELRADPSWETFWSVAERFTDDVGLGSPRLRAVLRGLRRRGARAAQAMFGNSFFATLPDGPGGSAARRWLLRAGVAHREVGLDRRGARRLRPPVP